MGEPVNIVCGTSVVSNPLPTILWLDASGDPISNSGRYTFINNSAEVSLNIAYTRPEDNGYWTCLVVVTDNDAMMSNNMGELVPRDITEIGRMTNRVALIVVGEYNYYNNYVYDCVMSSCIL